jgi:CDP-glycerol glycerophosphotransferase (TagB/SpsB family)
MFLSSDLLITDCISFLTEYALTLKPVIHLRKNKQKDEFNSIVKKLDTSYYQVYSNEELEKIFNSLIKDNNDFLKEKRERNIDILNTSTPASKKIYEYIKKE